MIDRDMRIWLDDKRMPPRRTNATGARPAPWEHLRTTMYGGVELYTLPDSDWLWFKDAQNLILLLIGPEHWDRITLMSLDHDLGEGQTGYDVTKVIEQLAHEGRKVHWQILIHSQNPVGVRNMQAALKSARKRRNHDPQYRTASAPAGAGVSGAQLHGGS